MSTPSNAPDRRDVGESTIDDDREPARNQRRRMPDVGREPEGILEAFENLDEQIRSGETLEKKEREA